MYEEMEKDMGWGGGVRVSDSVVYGLLENQQPPPGKRRINLTSTRWVFSSVWAARELTTPPPVIRSRRGEGVAIPDPPSS